jgi:GNAT superfamily N-acetyltransferase
MADLTIRPIQAGDRAEWNPLWAGYLAFYETTIQAEVTELTWTRLTKADGISGLLAIDIEGHAIGFAHFIFHPTTWSTSATCYLEDLFVVPAARGKRVGRQLIAAVADAARAKRARSVYWQTEEFNGTARRLYERVAKRTPFIRYRIDL